MGFPAFPLLNSLEPRQILSKLDQIMSQLTKRLMGYDVVLFPGAEPVIVTRIKNDNKRHQRR